MLSYRSANMKTKIRSPNTHAPIIMKSTLPRGEDSYHDVMMFENDAIMMVIMM